MRYFEQIICCIFGLALTPMIVLMFKATKVFLIIFLLIAYGFGGYLIGKKLSTKNYLVNSLLFGLGPVFWTLIFLYGLGWGNELGGEWLLVILSLGVTSLSVICSKASTNTKQI